MCFVAQEPCLAPFPLVSQTFRFFLLVIPATICRVSPANGVLGKEESAQQVQNMASGLHRLSTLDCLHHEGALQMLLYGFWCEQLNTGWVAYVIWFLVGSFYFFKGLFLQGLWLVNLWIPAQSCGERTEHWNTAALLVAMLSVSSHQPPAILSLGFHVRAMKWITLCWGFWNIPYEIPRVLSHVCRQSVVTMISVVITIIIILVPLYHRVFCSF